MIGERRLAETITDIVSAHLVGTISPAATIARTYERIRKHADPAIFIHLRPEAEALAEAAAITERGPAGLPLFGIPIAVKDNIDVAGMPTTAACEAFRYVASKDATAVAKLRAAGAIVVGKTNLDQFATGLVGVRSPYGIPRNTIKADLIPGGSSSGSAVAVAAGLVPMALGTDTAGSGRVPAGLNNIVGLKPSLGLVSTTGVVPACRSLDCVSIFALTTDDAWMTLGVIAGPDPSDPYSRDRPIGHLTMPDANLNIGVPLKGQRIFFGDHASEAAFDQAIARCAAMGARIVETDIEALYETARLLYDGPWVAERYLAIRSLLASSPDALHPVTKSIIIPGARLTATDTFSAFYHLEELRRVRDIIFKSIDALLLPTAPTAYTVAQVLADPVQLNSRLGTYTNFVNLLDLCGLAIPSSIRAAGIPFGVTLLAPGGQDARVSSIGRILHADSALPLGALNVPQPPLGTLPAAKSSSDISIAVVGAHMSGMPLNGELQALGGKLSEKAKTASDYKLYALSGGDVAKPGLLRVAPGTGASIDIEIWKMPAASFGHFVAAVPPPMAIGTLTLADGRTVKGFLVEPEALARAKDISQFGGWRAYLTSKVDA
ncbi:MAG: allophanate hydrolase [Xanthobacteraceae bacterium]